MSENSGIRWKRDWVCVTHTLAAEYVGLEEVDDGLWDVYFGPLKLGRMESGSGESKITKAEPFGGPRRQPTDDASRRGKATAGGTAH